MATGLKTWLWANDIDVNRLNRDDLKRAYNLDRDGCSASTCKRNCVQKPKCLYWMGEKKWLEKDADYWEGNQTVDVTARHNQDFCGLKNLGATCYVNSLLQVLFHNQFLRRAIYLWNPELDSKESNLWLQSQQNQPSLSNGSNHSHSQVYSPETPSTSQTRNRVTLFQPKSPIGQLQWVFARLQFGYCKYVDPTPFVKSLDLDVSQQQDAQEFCKLFLNLLEEDLGTQNDPLVRSVVQDEYLGEYNYETECLKCNTVNRSPSKFYELSLNIEGNSNIQECLTQFVTAEVLEGSNAYSCSVCNEKQTATRAIRLTRLPKTLNLQLMRFIFDRNKGTRKKLNSVIAFPEKLDMAPYLSSSSESGSDRSNRQSMDQSGDRSNRQSMDQSGDRKGSKPIDTMYQLTAVLVHFGNSAHSGHYVAHIKDQKSGSWYKFNDERVERIDDLVGKLEPADEGNDCEIVDELGKFTSVTGGGARGGQDKDGEKVSSNQVIGEKVSNSQMTGEKTGREMTGEKTGREMTGEKTGRGRPKKAKQKKNESSDPPGTLSSKNAYMLVYSKSSRDHCPVDINWNQLLPPSLASRISFEKTGFEEWSQKFAETQNWLVEKYRSKQIDVVKFYEICEETETIDILSDDDANQPMDVADGGSISESIISGSIISGNEREFISKDWISIWFKSTPDQLIPPIDNSVLLCPHSKIDLNKVSDFKCISSKAANFLRSRGYTINPRLTESDLCMECVQDKVKYIQLRAQIQDDAKRITELSKDAPVQGRPNYWVGVKCFKNWRSFAMADPEENEANSEKFNEEIVCSHGDLIFETSGRKVVTGELWSILRKYFPNCPEFRSTHEVCPKCQNDRKALEDELTAAAQKATEQKQLLSDFFTLKKRPKLNQDIEEIDLNGGDGNTKGAIGNTKGTTGNTKGTTGNTKGTSREEYYVVSTEFHKKWKSFIENPTKNEAPIGMKNRHLLCSKHGNLLYPLESEFLPSDPLLLVSEEEWEIVSQLYPPDDTICVRRKRHVERNNECNNKFISIPPHCEPCYQSLLEEERIKRLEYKRATISVRKIQPESVEEGEDEDIEVIGGSAKGHSLRNRSSGMGDQQRGNASEKPSQTNSSGSSSPPRRSTRLRRGPDQKDIIVSSDDTLKNLKVKVMELFKIATFDQNLSLDGIPLTDNEKTLAQLSVFPSSVLELRVDLPDPNAVEDPKEETGPETGFKGTRLIR